MGLDHEMLISPHLFLAKVVVWSEGVYILQRAVPGRGPGGLGKGMGTATGLAPRREYCRRRESTPRAARVGVSRGNARPAPCGAKD